MKKSEWLSGLMVLVAVLVGNLAYGFVGEAQIPPCLDQEKRLEVENEKVLEWKEESPDQFLARARVRGEVLRVSLDRKSHIHFVIQIVAAEEHGLEVVFNKAFGPLPEIRPGDDVEACGD
jgi:hypothetical protein